MQIRRAKKDDVDDIQRLLRQVLNVHYSGRPDIFKGNTQKYTEKELGEILEDETTPVFVCEDEQKGVVAHAFCVLQENKGSNILCDIKTLYIDDICVDENHRGQHIGKRMYEYVISYAKEINCYNVTLNVWALNKNALKFYESCGFVPQKIGMEQIL